MKKTVGLIACALLSVYSCFCLPLHSAAAEETIEIFLGQESEKYTNETGVWQSAAMLNRGVSPVKYGLEKIGEERNTFLRFSNFDASSVTDTSVLMSLSDGYKKDSAVISFRYRLFEGKENYRGQDPVFGFSYNGVQKVFTYSELENNSAGDFAWNEAEFELTGFDAGDRDFCELTFYFAGVEPQQSGSFDIDDVQFGSSDSNFLLQGDFEFAAADEGEDPIYSYDPQTDGIEAKKALMLTSEQMQFSVNTQYSSSAFTGFDFGNSASALAKAGNSATYRGSTSVKAGEGDSYAIYNAYDDNTFIRLGNFNSTKGISSNRFVSYFYDEQTGNEVESLPGGGLIYYSFRYRLFIDDLVRAGLTDSDTIFTLTVKAGTSNTNGGKIKLGDLAVNEEGDDTWHTYSGVWEATTSSSPYIMFQFDGYDAAASFSTKTFADIDDLYISKSPEGMSRVHLGGTFEGLASRSGTDAEEFLYFNEVLGAPAEKYAFDSINFAMKADAGESFSVLTEFAKGSEVYYLSFDINAEQADIGLYFSGRGGKYISLQSGRSGDFDGGALSVRWTEQNGIWHCQLFAALNIGEGLRSLDFVNEGNSPFLLDNLFAGQVEKVDASAGDYAAYQAALSALIKDYEAQQNRFASDALRQIERSLYSAKTLSEYANQAGMDEALAQLRDLLASSEKKSDLDGLKKAIAVAEERIAGMSKEDFTKFTWLNFYEKLAEAKLADENDAQEYIDTLSSELSAATQALEEVGGVDISALPVIGGLAGGGLLVGSVVYAVKRRKR